MSAKDIFHDAVKIGLQKEKWVITDDPLRLQQGGVDLYVDLGAEKFIGAEKEGEKIAVEIKSFTAPSNISEFHTAIGQFMNYRVALEEQKSDRVLYLAVPLTTYETFFNLQFIQVVIQRYQIKLIIYDPLNEVIALWKN
jgi:hypothetical protein